MRRKNFWIAAGCVLTVLGLIPVFSSGAAPASREKVLYSFTGGSDGWQPLSDLTIDGAGNLYGTTSRGGSAGYGTVFELKRTRDGWKEQVLYNFTGKGNGELPQTGLIFDRAGNLYGTTPGNVFELSPNAHGGWTQTVLYTFNNSDGDFPAGDLAFDEKGNLYGANSQGGTGVYVCNQNGCGTVFELMPQAGGSWTETTIHVFDPNSSDGAVPSSGVVLDSAGNVYGMTLYGGTGTCNGGINGNNGCGTIYELTPGSAGNWTETIPYSFVQGCALGIRPSGGFFLDKAGHLRGTSQAGGDGFGTVFELRRSQKNGWRQSALHLFYGNPDGTSPVGRLAVDTDGDLFGVTSSGGANRNGIVLELRPAEGGWKETIVHTFGGTGDGSMPQAGLVLDARGHLYGTTQYGGTGTSCQQGCGTVYEVNP